MNQYVFCLFLLAFGFSFAGIFSSAYAVITKETPQLKVLGSSYLESLGYLIFTIIAGPAIMLNCVFAMRKEKENRCLYTLTFAAFTASCWSMLTGLFIIAAFLKLVPVI